MSHSICGSLIVQRASAPLQAEQKFARQNYVELMILKQENEHISQGYVAISVRHRRSAPLTPLDRFLDWTVDRVHAQVPLCAVDLSCIGALALHTWPVPVLVPLALLSVASAATRSFVHCAEPLQERLNSKLDELAEVEETRDVYKKQKDKALEQLSQLQELLQKQSESQQVANELLKSVEQNVKAKGARAQQRAAVTLSPGAEDAYEDDFEED